MKNATKRLIISIAALVIAVALAATTTFAWFTLDTTPEVTDIDLTVTSTDGLYVSVDATTSALNPRDYRTYIEDTTSLANAVPVTYESGFKKLAKENTAGSNTYAYESAIANTDYASQTFYFRSLTEYKVVLSSVTVTANAEDAKVIVAWRDFTAADLDVTGTYDTEKASLYPNATNAEGAALSTDAALDTTDVLIPEGTALTGTALDTVAANSLRIGAVISDEMYAVNPKAGEGLDEVDVSASENIQYASHDYFKTMTNTATMPTSWDTPKTYTPLVTSGNHTVLATLAKISTETDTNYVDSQNNYFFGSVTLNYWFEGTDADCFNEILGDSVSISFIFSGVAV